LLAQPEHGLGAMAQTGCQILVRKVCPNSVLTARGTEGSNLLSSSGESGANLIFGDGTDPFATAKPNARLVKLLLRARRFNAALTQGEGIAFAALAQREGVPYLILLLSMWDFWRTVFSRFWWRLDKASLV
jgi:hypothetical protein